MSRRPQRTAFKAKIELKDRAVTSICPCKKKHNKNKQKRKRTFLPNVIKTDIILTIFPRKFAPSSADSLSRGTHENNVKLKSLSSCKFQAQEAHSSLPPNDIKMSWHQNLQGVRTIRINNTGAGHLSMPVRDMICKKPKLAFNKEHVSKA